MLDGVLGSDDHERRADRVADAIDGDAAFFHDLEKGRLGLGAGAVDLVSEDDGRENRARMELEASSLRVEDCLLYTSRCV